MKDILDSIKYNFIERTTNPFLGTYLGVWLVRNWELIFMLFNFDKGETMSHKIDIIKNYFSNNSFVGNLFLNIAISLGILVLTYILLNFSRAIINLFEKVVTPWVYEITDKGSVVLKTKYDTLQERLIKTQELLNEERISKFTLQEEKDALEDALKKSNNSKDGNVNKLLTEKVEKTVKMLEEDNMDGEFKGCVLSIKNGNSLSKTSKTKERNYFITHNLIIFDKISTSESSYYKLTELGELVFEYMKDK